MNLDMPNKLDPAAPMILSPTSLGIKAVYSNPRINTNLVGIGNFHKLFPRLRIGILIRMAEVKKKKTKKASIQLKLQQ